MGKRAQFKIGDYDLVEKFSGYRAREDQTKLDSSFHVSPSKNVVINTSGRMALVKGFVLDGATSVTIDSGILSNYDFINFKSDYRNLRAGFLTSAGNDGKLQYRYLDATGTVHWVDLKTGLTNVRLSYTDWWDATALVRQCLWVDGSADIFSWNGAVTTLASATINTVTKQDSTKTWAQEGFSTTGSIVIGGVTATYSGGTGTQTLTGVSVDFSASAVASIVHQSVITTSSFTQMPLTTCDVIGCGRKNQVYLGSKLQSTVYISKPTSFSDYSYSSPVRLVNEGFYFPLSAPPTKFIPQESKESKDAYDMYISEGKNSWSVITSQVTIAFDASGTPSATTEKLERIPFKTGPLLGAISERLVTKMKNEICFIANDKVANFFGYQSYQYVPAIIDFSYPIIDDMNSYDFTDGSIFYHRNYLYIAIPKSGLIRVYNMTDQTKQYSSYYRDVEDVTQQPWFWEAPITYPISGFYVTPDKGLCGHSYTTSESYQLFTGGSFNGQDIDSNLTFAYDAHGERTQSMRSNEIWLEGYIKQNTKLQVNIRADLDSFSTVQSVIVDGNDPVIVAYGTGGHSLGKDSLGSKPLGGTDLTTNTLPAWFHVAKTYSSDPTPYLEQISFETKGVDLQWELITFGTNAERTVEGNSSITQ